MVRAMRRALFLFAAACGSPASSQPPPHLPTQTTPVVATPAPDPTPPTFRLPAVARPLHETVDLAIDPASEDFTGTITTELDVSRRRP